MAASTKVLTMIDMIVNGANRTLFMMKTDLGREISSEFK